MNKDGFLPDEERGIDPTNIAANDCSWIQNAPLIGVIPRWWLEEGTVAEVKEWKRQIENGEAILE